MTAQKPSAPKNHLLISLTSTQLEWLKIHYLSGKWSEIAAEFNKKFKTNKSANALRKLYNKYKNVDLTGEDFQSFTRESLEQTEDTKIKEGRFVVTAVLPMVQHKDGSLTGEANIAAIKTITSQSDRSLILLPTLPHSKPLDNRPPFYDPRLTPYQDHFKTEVCFNKNLYIVDAKILPQQKKPLTSMEDYTSKGSVIVAHPRQHMALFATGNAMKPGMIASTGAINYPSYQDNRIGNLAKMKHRMGGRIVEVKGDKFFQRKIIFDDRGGYFDLNYYYHYNGNRKVRVKALRVGDIHFGHHNEELMQILFEIIILLQPEILIFDDAFDGYCVNHHLTLVDKVLRPAWAYSIETEAAVAREQMNRIKKVCPPDCKIYWTHANHNNFLMRYLKERRYINDEVNFFLAHELILEIKAGRNPLAKVMGLDYINYLGPNDNLFVEDIQMANHGHQGLNGAKGSRSSLKKTATKLSTAHTHSPFEDDDHDGLGHWSDPDHGYNEGASTWLPSILSVYEGGATQQYLAIKGTGKNAKYEWKL